MSVPTPGPCCGSSAETPLPRSSPRWSPCWPHGRAVARRRAPGRPRAGPTPGVLSAGTRRPSAVAGAPAPFPADRPRRRVVVGRPRGAPPARNRHRPGPTPPRRPRGRCDRHYRRPVTATPVPADTQRRPTAVDAIADAHFDASVALDPIAATALGVPGHDAELTDYSPEGHASRARLRRRTLRALDGVQPADAVDRVTVAALRERLGLED